MAEYTGFRHAVLSDEEANRLLCGEYGGVCGCLRNEYLTAETENGADLGCVWRSDGEKLVKVPYKTVASRFLGKVKPRNIQQQMAIDMLYNPEITVKVITGRFGSGKDYLMCSVAVDLIERNRFERIVYVRNNVEVKDSRPIGYLPGSFNEKMLPFAMPMSDHLGGTDGLQLMISHGKIEIVHLGFIRGRDIKNSIILCSEAENMTKEHVQLLLGRVGEGSELWINGDFKQCDAEVFRRNSGLMAAVDRLKGHPRFGYVKLLKTERSETAAMADLLD